MKKAFAQSKCFFLTKFAASRQVKSAVKCTCGAWNIRFADVKRQISYHRDRSSLFHNLRQANSFTLSKSEIFHYKSFMCIIDKMIFCIYMNAKANKQHRKRYQGWTRKPQRFRFFHADFLGGIQKIFFPQLFTHFLGEKSIFWF